MRFASRETIDKIKASIAKIEEKINQTQLTLDNAGQLSESALEVKIGKGSIGYIDAGMSADEFVYKALCFCASSRSSVDAIPLRASYTVALVEESLPRDEPASLALPIKIFATNTTGERFEISDLYWFEENGVHDWHDESFTFEFYLEENPWKPIDTAPVDGTYVLTCAVGQYYNPTVAAWRTTADGVKHWKDYAGNKITATHWMPLPEPPENSHAVTSTSNYR